MSAQARGGRMRVADPRQRARSDARNHRLNVGVIARKGRKVEKTNLATHGHDQFAALLEGIARSGGLNAPCKFHLRRTKHGTRIHRAPQRVSCPQSGVRFSPRIGVQRRADAVGIAKVLGHPHRAVANEGELGTPRLDLILTGGETSSLLAAKQSAEVAKPHDNRRILRPELPQRDGYAIQIQHRDRPQSFDDFVHPARITPAYAPMSTSPAVAPTTLSHRAQPSFSPSQIAEKSTVMMLESEAGGLTTATLPTRSAQA